MVSPINPSSTQPFNPSAFDPSQIKAHPGWKGELSEESATEMLQEQAPLTYLIRKGKEPNAYVLSFVESDGNIAHKTCTFKSDRAEWEYRNATLHQLPSFTEMVEKMAHCEFAQLSALTD